MKKELSPELDILITAIKHQFEKKGDTPIFRNNTYNSSQLTKLYRYHGLQALLNSYENSEKYMLDTNRDELKYFMTNQVIKNMKYAAETSRLLKLFSDRKIPLYVLKGNLLIQGIYQNKQVRATSDLDVLIEKKQLKKSLEILLEDGYRINSPNLIHLHSLPEDLEDLIINKSLHNEIHLQKGIFNLDFHWDLFQNFFYQKYQEKEVLINRVLKLTEATKINGIETRQLNPEGQFWMILAHHGAKESWLKLRHIQDFHALMHQFEKQIDWVVIISQVEDYRLTNTLKNGLFILKTYLNYTLPPILDHYIKDINLLKMDIIIREWENATYWGTKRALMIRNLYLTTLFQDEDFSYLKHIRIYFNYFKILKQIEHYPNPYNSRQLLNSTFLLIKRLINKE